MRVGPSRVVGRLVPSLQRRSTGRVAPFLGRGDKKGGSWRSRLGPLPAPCRMPRNAMPLAIAADAFLALGKGSHRLGGRNFALRRWAFGFKEGGEGAGQEEIIDRHDNLTVARAIYRGRVSQYPGRLIMLCDRARVLARSDRPETMP
jgi:hypothetical protein